MADVVDASKRSLMMGGIRGKDTSPELLIRKSLHRLGYRFRLHDSKLPGKPDMVFPRYRAVIEVQGCFWHGHGCHLFKWPSSREDFWRKKIEGNQQRDARNQKALLGSGWRVLLVWECSIKGRTRLEADEILSRIINWLENSEQGLHEIRGKYHGIG